jgi:dTDP-4-dehydrorhamnose reductase
VSGSFLQIDAIVGGASFPPKRWLVTGAGGLLGRDLVGVLAADGSVSVTAAAHADLDVTDVAAVRSAVEEHDIVVNCAAWTDADRAEAGEDEATVLNRDAVRILAEACAAASSKTRLIHISSDYVFGGDATSPYAEDAKASPINAYGRSKLAGEKTVLAVLPYTGYVVRTAWLYGAHGKNFVATMLDQAKKQEILDVVDDQRGQPTWTVALASQLAALGKQALKGSAPAGVYHGTASGDTTWFGLARAAFEESGLDPERIRPTTTAAYGRPARRPAYSVLGHERWAQAGLEPLGGWREMLTVALRTIGAAAAPEAASEK